MFVVKYSARGYKTKYLGNNGKLVTTLKAAIALGEGARKLFEENCNGTMSLKTIDVSEVAENMYHDTYVKVRDIKW